MEKHELSVSVGGKEIVFETGRIARQADGAVLVKSNDTVVMASACQTKKEPDDIDFLPLRVDYQEKFSSAGKTLGGFIKREGKPTEREVLTCRLIDRPLRPLFEDGYFNEVQLISYVLSYDNLSPPEPLAICAASAALVVSDIPLKKPVGAVTVGLIDGEFIINPSVEEMEKSDMELIMAGTKEAILMIEGYADFLPEEQILEAVEEGHAAIREICVQLEDWQKQIGKDKVRDYLSPVAKELIEEISNLIKADVESAVKIADKKEREEALKVINAKVDATFLEVDEPQHKKSHVKMASKKVIAGVMRNMILDNGVRSDGRRTDQIRNIWVEPSLLPRTHGSALFTRGETQSIAVCTLGPETMGQRYEDLEDDKIRRFYLQYSFPPFSVGEVGRMGPTGRREIGHGKLAEKALRFSVPPVEEFPYTIRVESNITESNGSSSMASVCGGCLAMMDAGVPIKRPVAGIAMGLILEDKKTAILSDILGVEDALGDMDFKITGDKDGITAFQLDIKIEGITPQIMKSALLQAKEGRIHILNKMLEVCPESRDSLSDYAPRIETINIAPSKVGIVIGPGGKQIKAIVAETGVDININDDGPEAVIALASNDAKMMERAKEIIHFLTADVEVGETYEGTVVSIVDFGMFVQVLNKEGLCHISEIDHLRIEKVGDHFKEGDKLEVKVIDVNDRGQVKLSRKALLPRPEGMPEEPPRRPREDRRDGGGRRDNRRDGRRDNRRDNRRDDKREERDSSRPPSNTQLNGAKPKTSILPPPEFKSLDK